jgi:Ca2+-binding EF-hand superfamily protein
VAGSDRQLTPENLAAEFKRIDTDNGGTISREELWEFISSGKAGDLSESDFNSLFSAIDLYKSGSVDFMEFAAFFGKCSEDFERVGIVSQY